MGIEKRTHWGCVKVVKEPADMEYIGADKPSVGLYFESSSGYAAMFMDAEQADDLAEELRKAANELRATDTDAA